MVKNNEQLAGENLSLSVEIERLENDPKFIENVARQELGMIAEDELILKPKQAPNRWRLQMINNNDFYTVTLAKVYEDQGHWEKAVEIYRYLLEQEPDRKDFAEALAETERKMDEAIKKTPDDLIPLFREWIDLLLRYSRLQKLRRFKSQL